MAKALAARDACSYSTEHSFSSLIFESDSSSLVSATRDVVPHTSFGGRVYDDIISLLLELPGSHFLHVFREANVLANDCAHCSYTFRCSFSWVGAPPR